MSAHAAVTRPLVIVPTYNERDNLGSVLSRLRSSAPGIAVLVVDDNSPDGTGDLAEQLAADAPPMWVLHRAGKGGLGSAYRAGFTWALQRDFDAVVEMDADGSHPPERVPALLDALTEVDVALGSRWVAGGSVVDWPRWREALSRGGNRYARWMLSLPVSDSTGGFRAYRRDALVRVHVDDVASQGYCFQIDLARRAYDAGLAIRELPIEFVERQSGSSKMSRAIVAEALWRVTMWGIDHRLPPAMRERGGAPAVGSTLR